MDGVSRLNAATTRQTARITGIEPARRISRCAVDASPSPDAAGELAESASRLRSGRSCAAGARIGAGYTAVSVAARARGAVASATSVTLDSSRMTDRRRDQPP